MNKFLSISAVFIHLMFGYTSAQPFNELSSDLQKRYAYCLKLMGNEQYQLAIKGLQRLLADYPDFHLPYRNLVETYIFQEHLDEAISYFQNLKENNPQNHYIYYALARIDFHKEEYQAAIEKLKKCISLDPNFPDAYGPFGGLPEVYKVMNKLDSGEIFFKQLIEKLPDNPYAYYGLGRIYVKKGLWDDALRQYKRSIETDSTLTYSYHASLFIYSVKGEYQAALNSGERLLELAQSENDFEMVAYALLRIGGFYFFAGNFEKSLDFFTQSLQIASRIGATRREGMALTNMGALYATLGKKTKALEYFKHSLHLMRKTDAFRTEIRTLYNMGVINKDLQQYDKAFHFFDQALQLAINRGYQIENSMILTGMAEALVKQNNLKEALSNYERALEIAREVKDKAEQGYILKKLGDLHYELHNFKTAIQHYGRSLEFGKITQDAQIIWEANTGLGAAYQEREEKQKAIYHYAKAIAVYDSIRKDLSIATLASGFLEDKYDVYSSIIHLLAQEQKLDKAFDYVEKYKAKTLLKILAKGQLSISELLPDSVRFSLIENKNQLEDAHFEYSKELSKARPDKERLLSLDQKITALELQKSSIIKTVKKNFNPYFQMTSAEPIALSELQSNILEPQQLLMEFVIGSSQASVFAVTTDTLIYYEVPMSRDKLKQMLLNLSDVFQSLTPEGKKQSEYIFSPEQADFSIPPAFALYNKFIKPVEFLINEAEDLIIVPDDFLFYLPFEMLISDTSNIQSRYDFENAKYLIQKVNISYLQSASLLNPRLHRTREPSRVLIAFGNPTFEDARAVAESNQASDISAMRQKTKFVSLPNSEKEVKNISRLFSESKEVYTGKRASERIFTRP